MLYCENLLEQMETVMKRARKRLNRLSMSTTPGDLRLMWPSEWERFYFLTRRDLMKVAEDCDSLPMYRQANELRYSICQAMWLVLDDAGLFTQHNNLIGVERSYFVRITGDVIGRFRDALARIFPQGDDE